MAFGDNFFDKIDRGVKNEDVLYDPQKIDTLLERLKEKMRHASINMEEFLGKAGYNDEETERDIQSVGDMQEIFAKENAESPDADFLERIKKQADVAEFIITDKLCGKWMNERATAFHTAPYDDYKEKIDIVLRLSDLKGGPSTYSGIGVDVARTVNDTAIFDKLRLIMQKAKTNTLARVKYFYDDIEDTYQPLEGLAQFVVIINHEHLKDLAKKEYLQDRSGLENDVFQLIILLQFKVICEAVLRAANNADSFDVIHAYEEVWVHIEEILESKQDMLLQYPDIEKDETIVALKTALRLLGDTGVV